MKRIFALSILSLFFAAAGCGAGPDVRTPESDALAQKLTHDARLAGDSSTDDPEAAVELTSTSGQFSNIVVHCNLRCIMGCGPLGDDACAHSCCEVR